MINFGRSKDGVRRVTIRVEHRASRDDLHSALCQAAADGRFGDVSEHDDIGDALPERMPQGAIIDTAREMYKSRGQEAVDYWADDVHPEMAEAIEEWATGVIDYAFPANIYG